MELKIEVVENGFVVWESCGYGNKARCRAFESPMTLARFCQKWAEENFAEQEPKTGSVKIVREEDL